MQKLTAHDIRRIAVEARRDPRTVRAAYDGRARDVAVTAISEAAERLGYPPPVEAERRTP